MVPTAIRALRDKPRKGSSLSAIKGFMAEEWGINIQTYAPKIKKYILKAVENGELLQTKGKGAAGRFTVPGLKARKRKSKTTKRLSKKFDEDEVEYEPGKSARDEAREQTEVVLCVLLQNTLNFTTKFLQPLLFVSVLYSHLTEKVAFRWNWQSAGPVWRKRPLASLQRRR